MIIQFRIRESNFIENVECYYAEKLITNIGDPPHQEKKWECIDNVVHLTYDKAKESILNYIEKTKRVRPKDIIYELPELTISVNEQSDEPRLDVCKCCGTKMKIQGNPEFICVNPYCDNYIKTNRYGME